MGQTLDKRGSVLDICRGKGVADDVGDGLTAAAGRPPRRRQATARPTARLLAKHLNRTRARLEQGQASSRQAHWLAYYLPATCLLLACYLPTTCLLLAYYLPTTCQPLAYPLPKPSGGGAGLARETEEIDEPEDGHTSPLYII